MRNIAFDFTDRTVVVTGAARGIGLSLAAEFVNAGAVVYLLDVDRDEVFSSAECLGATGMATDVTNTQEVNAAVAAIIHDAGRIDVLINNAGVLRDKVLWKLTDEEWDTVQQTHAGGTFRMTRACVPHFRDRGYGRIVNVTSYSGLHGNTGQSNYATTKAGIVGFTKTAAKELARFGVTVNAISPNAETRMISSVPEDKRAQLVAAIPMARFADPAEMFSAVAFLSSEEAGYVTGVILPVDGGLSM